ncbi:DUF3889 domain-containing protein [Lysinibacillus sp. NPDC097162]|uniref:DUF3889 domain-containing protein n=1 Tax=Lysinibacillus sp. NPDC097162 TaxID=3364140 RepID=UPI00380B8C7C
MRKLLVALGIFMIPQAVPLPMLDAHAEVTPAYAKWGKLAIEKTQSSYPNSKIIDYLHEGSEVNEEATIEKFKLWLKEGDKEFGVYVRIKYTTETQKVLDVELQETAK